MSSSSHLILDEEGYFAIGEIRISDVTEGHALMANLRLNSFQLTTEWQDRPIIVESFTSGLVGLQVAKPTAATNDPWSLQLAYGCRKYFKISSLVMDEWDRFHGETVDGLPFVLSRAAQGEMFQLVDDYDDESLTVGGERFVLPAYYFEAKDIDRADYWTDRYRDNQAPWDLGEVTPPLKNLYFKLKWPRSRVLVLGAGAGHDGAFLASQGHRVTCVDVSEEAIARAIEKYGRVPQLDFQRQDAFHLPTQFRQNFDAIIEHTFFCAIDPVRRRELVRVWRSCLREGGFLLGVFFVMPKREGPPYGGSEWELRQRFRNQFRSLIWHRATDSIPSRLGKELVVYASKVD